MYGEKPSKGKGKADAKVAAIFGDLGEKAGDEPDDTEPDADADDDVPAEFDAAYDEWESADDGDAKKSAMYRMIKACEPPPAITQ